LNELKHQEALEFERAELQRQVVEHNRQQEEIRIQTLANDRAELTRQALEHERQLAQEAERLKVEMHQIKILAEDRHAHVEFFHARRDTARMWHETEQDKVIHQTDLREEQERISKLHEDLLTSKAINEQKMQAALLELQKQNLDLQAALASERNKTATRPPSLRSTPRSEPEYFDIMMRVRFLLFLHSKVHRVVA